MDGHYAAAHAGGVTHKVMQRLFIILLILSLEVAKYQNFLFLILILKTQRIYGSGWINKERRALI